MANEDEVQRLAHKYVLGKHGSISPQGQTQTYNRIFELAGLQSRLVLNDRNWEVKPSEGMSRAEEKSEYERIEEISGALREAFMSADEFETEVARVRGVLQKHIH